MRLFILICLFCVRVLCVCVCARICAIVAIVTILIMFIEEGLNCS